MTPTIRRATHADLPEIVLVDGRSFHSPLSDTEAADVEKLFEPDRFLLACEDGSIVGITGSYPFTVTLPGRATVPAPGVTWVSVAATHRKRGIMRALMVEQHREFLADGLPVSLLTASESGIYGRFGYGEATRNRWVEIDRRFVAFRADAPDPGGVRFATTGEAQGHAEDVHRRWCAVTPGAIARSEAWWHRFWLDREYRRGGRSAQFHLVHPDGYATYRTRWNSGDTVDMTAEVFAATPDAHAALWRVLLGTDLVTEVRIRIPLDDPLPLLLTYPRLVRTSALTDGMWARVLDVAAALAARRYAVEVDAVLEVRDGFLDRGGRFRLRGGPDGATCEPVTGTPDVALDVAHLGSLLFGGHRARTLARAGVLTATDDAALARVDAAFVTDREPVHGTDF